MVAKLGGPNGLLEKPNQYFDKAPLVSDVLAPSSGVISEIAARNIGLGVIVLGGGRKRPDEKIDYCVGYDQLAGIGENVSAGSLIGRVHGRNENEIEEAKSILLNAYCIGANAPENKLIVEHVTATGGT